MSQVTCHKSEERIWVIYFLILVFCLSGFNSFAEDVKEPNVAGAFYPSDPVILAAQVDGFLAKADPQPFEGKIFALISPHAGYEFSGAVSGFGYKLIKDQPYKTIVILAPSHQYAFRGVSVYTGTAFRTPLGDIPVDSEISKKLLGRDPEISFEPRAFLKEHALEVQLPFLQRALKDFKIVAIVLGDCGFSTCQHLANLLRENISSREDVLVVASTDMYHGHDYSEAINFDSLTLSAIKDMDPEKLYNGLKAGNFQLCGGYGVVTALLLANDLGYKKINVLKYTDSAQVTGNKTKGNWTVGYSSVAIGQEKKEVGMLNKDQRKKLLGIARKSIESYLKHGKKPDLNESDSLLSKEMGSFVTLHEAGQLRGCIGNMVGTQPLYLTVRDMAIEAATGDPRFSPVKLSELKNIEMEISVLSPLEKVDSAEKIELGKHGVIVRRGFNSGVFLPQVATETGWTKDEFLSHLCSQKAGLSPNAWKDKSTEIFIFTAEVFSEKDY
ncbi:MAG: AmmeMemoRadiSam system protein B [Candidatus Omnitrophica bacterium]|nr:AmmeMemoRadiSam system protein B [Candidatus Omnitrophota bacterium]